MLTHAVATLPTEPVEISEAELRALAELKLLDEDGVPLENAWHRLQIALLHESICQLWRERTDFFVGGNMFIYYSVEQAKTRDYKGPDLFVVKGVVQKPRPYWVVWDEGRAPDLVVELLSESTRSEDLGRKRVIYEQALRVPEYVCFGPDPTQTEALELYLWRLVGGQYQLVAPDNRGWVWSEVLGVWLGLWEGRYVDTHTRWLRLHDHEGQLVPTEAEAERRRAEAEQQRAEQERQRAEAERQRAEAEQQRAEQERQRAERFAARLRELGVNPDEL